MSENIQQMYQMFWGFLRKQMSKSKALREQKWRAKQGQDLKWSTSEVGVRQLLQVQFFFCFV